MRGETGEAAEAQPAKKLKVTIQLPRIVGEESHLRDESLDVEIIEEAKHQEQVGVSNKADVSERAGGEPAEAAEEGGEES